jgi:hypothetical protein
LHCEAGHDHTDQIIARLRRKAEIVRLDTKARQDAVHHDMNDILTLLNMLERALTKEQDNGTA